VSPSPPSLHFVCDCARADPPPCPLPLPPPIPPPLPAYQNYGNQFFEEANAPHVAYIRRLSAARIDAKLWMVHGRATRSLALNDATGALLGGCFLREKPNEAPSVVCAIAAPAASPATATYKLAIDPAKYGLGGAPAGAHVQLTDLQTGAALGSFAAGAEVAYSAPLAAFGVQLLKLEIAA